MKEKNEKEKKAEENQTTKLEDKCRKCQQDISPHTTFISVRMDISTRSDREVRLSRYRKHEMLHSESLIREYKKFYIEV